MLLLRAPSNDRVQRFLDEQRRRETNFPAVGATAGIPPDGYSVDHTRIKLGSGKQTFDAATSALARWQQFQLGWVEALPRDTPIRTGEVVAVVARTFGVWWLNACRIVSVIEERGDVHRFGFAYATLPGHVERGEERFLVEWDQLSGDVWYDILAISRPRHLLAWIGYPLVRRLQRRFARDSAAAMLRCVSGCR